jgi:Fe-S cluster biogenesis protein NfuA
MSMEASASAITAEQVEAVLDRVRPAIRSDGGDIELVAIEGNNVHVRLQGHCVGCPSSMMTLKFGVERALREEIPDFGELITDLPDLGF